MNRQDRRANRKALRASWRKCGTCTECCISLPIKELNKPEGVPCKSLKPDHGCARYDTRPNVCRDFACLWAMNLVANELRPDKLGIVLKMDHNASFGSYMEAVVKDTATFEANQNLLVEIGQRFGCPVGVRFPGTNEGFFLNISAEQFERVESSGLGRRRLPLL